MSWARLDDRFHGNPKVLRVWHVKPASIGLYVMGLTYCAQHETDGFIDLGFVRTLLPTRREFVAITTPLCDENLWTSTPDGFDIPDYLDFNPSREDQEKRRETKRKAGRKGGIASGRSRANAEAETKHGASAGKNTRPDPSPSNSTVAASGDAVVEVWGAYVETRTAVLGPRSAPTLTAARRRLITARLKEHPAADLVDAVKGWRHSPHNRGENDRGRPFCDLELLLRDAGHIETFRDLERGRSSSGSVTDLAARINAAHEEAAA